MDPPVQAARRMWSVSAGARERAALRPSADRPCGRRVSRVVDRPISHDRLRVRPPPYQAASSRAKRHWFWSWAAGGSRPVPLHRADHAGMVRRQPSRPGRRARPRTLLRAQPARRSRRRCRRCRRWPRRTDASESPQIQRRRRGYLRPVDLWRNNVTEKVFHPGHR